MNYRGGRNKASVAVRVCDILTLLFFVLLFGGFGRCEAQANSQAPKDGSISSLQTAELAAASYTPIPITYSASSAVAPKNAAGKKLWRIAIIGAGSLPFTLFYTNFIFDSVRFATHSFDVQYAPWPFKTQYSAAVSTGETFLRLGVSAGVGVIIGIIDAVIQRR
ncbi:MAG: hypothetical protein WC820_07960 [Spirochaetales bacterium]|jgi:hypothetical protein